MISIEDLVIEQMNRILGEWNGGVKYGPDYNILKSIMKYHKNKNLVKSLVESLKDKILATKVRVWMAGAA